MTAVVSREHARGAYLTGAAGTVIIAIASVMMVVAAPGHAASGHATTSGHAVASGHQAGPAQPAAVQLATDACHRLTSRSDSATVRACLAGPSAVSAWADAYVPSITSESWSASSSARPSPARVAVS
jgi:hypothetical protein